MTDAIPLKIIDGDADGEKKLAELAADDVIPAAHLPPPADPNAVTPAQLAAHADDQTNPHAVTATQLGAAAATDLTAHSSDQANPHGVTAAQVGAATTAELTTHSGNADNPHGVTLAQVGGAAAADLTTHAANVAIHRLLDDTKTDAASLWSAAKILLEIQAKVNELIGAAPGTLDQLNEIAAALANDPNFAATITAQLALKAARVDLDAHVGDSNNPHGVTLAMLNGATLAQLNAHALATDNPHSITAAQAGAIPTADRGADSGVCELIAGLVPLARLPVFGSQARHVYADGVSSTTSTSFRDKASLATGDLPLGNYRLAVSYGWTHASDGVEFVSRVRRGGTMLGELHYQKPPEEGSSWSTTGTDQRNYNTRLFYLDGIQGINEFKVQYRSSESGETASIWDATMEFWRVL